MSAAPRSPIAVIVARPGMPDRTLPGQYFRWFVTIHRERFGQSTMASATHRLDHQGVLAEFGASRQGR